ncbi:MAG: transcriptional regulator NrdR [Caldisericia bacterium]|nr:transcriptional regulator NrdR [Caldisericia bacterium]MDD4614438.1 transcriptional regulator NrdR [Caldisericia bacterium]
MKCPFCNSTLHKVLDKRETKTGNSIRRRRECLTCGRRFTTYERIDVGNIMVVKRDQSRQPFDREKIKTGILKSTEKRPVTTQQIEIMIDSIESTIRKEYEKEVHSLTIGTLIMQELKNIDPVAYIRFASVYKDFRDIDEFVSEIHGLQNKGGTFHDESI